MYRQDQQQQHNHHHRRKNQDPGSASAAACAEKHQKNKFHQTRLKFWHVWLSGLVFLPCSRPAHQSNQLIDPSSQSNHPSVNPSINQLQSLG